MSLNAASIKAGMRSNGKKQKVWGNPQYPDYLIFDIGIKKLCCKKLNPSRVNRDEKI